MGEGARSVVEIDRIRRRMDEDLIELESKVSAMAPAASRCSMSWRIVCSARSCACNACSRWIAAMKSTTLVRKADRTSQAVVMMLNRAAVERCRARSIRLPRLPAVSIGIS